MFVYTGIVSSDGDMWREQRRFSLEVLRDFGMGKSILEDKIHEEIHFFIDEIASFDGRPFNPQHIIMYAVSNIIGSLISGSRMSYDDPRFKRYMDIMTEAFQVRT